MLTTARKAGAPLLIACTCAAHGAWEYDQQTDAMTSRPTLVARSESLTLFSLGSPYAGVQRATLTLRKHPRFGADVILQISRGQFNCGGYGGCSVLVRFDDRPAQRFHAKGTSDHSSDLIFIKDFTRFYGQAAKAKRVLIEVEFFNNGSRHLDFDIAGLDAKYLGINASVPRAAAKQETPNPGGLRGLMQRCNAAAVGLRDEERRNALHTCLTQGREPTAEEKKLLWENARGQ